jgi:DNA polymerase-3 subunit epsilon/exodeoxyribonuclease X
MLIFVDIARSGFEATDKICAIGVLAFEKDICTKSYFSLVNEGKKIAPRASALHNITNEMITNKETLIQSKAYTFLQACNNQDNILVVHNADFTLLHLAQAGLSWNGTIIDTQKLCKHTMQECEVFTLAFLRYELQLYKNEEIYKKEAGIKDSLIAHHALHNALVIKMLYDYLRESLSFEDMASLSFENVLLQKLPFGKFVGRYIEDIALHERAYLEWLYSLEDLDSDLRYSIAYYLKG